mgnify:CR=1 FL=1
MITAAVVIGVSSFAYLHNKKKVDFYHSIPVRREALFGAQFSGGIFIVGAAYGLNLLLLAGVAVSYGVPVGRILGAMAGGWALNMPVLRPHVCNGGGRHDDDGKYRGGCFGNRRFLFPAARNHDASVLVLRNIFRHYGQISVEFGPVAFYVGCQVPVSIQRIHQFLWLEDERTVKACSGAHLYGTGIFGSHHTGFGTVPQTSVRSSGESHGI